MTESADADIYPVGLQRKGDDGLLIEWNDGVQHVYSWSVLRKTCPCAACREERSKPEPLLSIIKPEEAQPARPKSMEPVGRYAYQVSWNDGHSSGIYTFEFLRQLGEQIKAEQGQPGLA